MNRAKNIAGKGKGTFNKLKDPVQRFQMKHEVNRKFISLQNLKRIFIFSGLIFTIQMMYNFRTNFYGTVSRASGRIANLQLPKFLLSPILKIYCRFYNVNQDEIRGEGLKQFTSISNFFTRKLKDGVRVIENKTNPNTVVSPCDGTVFNFGTCEEDTMVVVKGTPYKLDEFLFGTNESNREYFTYISEKIKKRGNELKFILFYLSPGDYHRFHSPAICSTNYRRHIVGNLHTVAPKAVAKYPETFVKNERVALFGEWVHGFFATSFIGATNVGSIVLNFDKDLRTNRVGVKKAEVFDKNYLDTTEFEGVFRSNLVIKKKSYKTMEEEKYDITSDIGIFDIKDMTSTDSGEADLTYREQSEHEFKFRLENQFSSDEEEKTNGFKYDEYQEELNEKLINPDSTVQKYSITNKGIAFEKGEEVGYFNLGSSIMLIMETPKGSEF